MELSEADLVEIRKALEKETLTDAIAEMGKVLTALCLREGYYKDKRKDKK